MKVKCEKIFIMDQESLKESSKSLYNSININIMRKSIGNQIKP